jgi:hypothetical protein
MSDEPRSEDHTYCNVRYETERREKERWEKEFRHTFIAMMVIGPLSSFVGRYFGVHNVIGDICVGIIVTLAVVLGPLDWVASND